MTVDLAPARAAWRESPRLNLSVDDDAMNQSSRCHQLAILSIRWIMYSSGRVSLCEAGLAIIGQKRPRRPMRIVVFVISQPKTPYTSAISAWAGIVVPANWPQAAAIATPRSWRTVQAMPSSCSTR